MVSKSRIIFLVILVGNVCAAAFVWQRFMLPLAAAANTSAEMSNRTPRFSQAFQSKQLDDEASRRPEVDANGNPNGNGVILAADTNPAPLLAAASSAEDLYASASPCVGVVAARLRGAVVAQGTGFLVHSSGLVVTNHHVIAQGTDFVFTAPGRAAVTLRRLRAVDEDADLAVLEAPGTGWPSLALAPADELQVGQRVYAIGNPLGLNGTFSEGMVSAERTIDGIDVIQTTAPISPGSSGGPLIDTQGRVVGINSFQIMEGQNLNFAVRVNHLLGLLGGTVNPVPNGTANPADPNSILAAATSPPPLRLEGIMGGREPAVVINGEIYHLGDRIAITDQRLDLIEVDRILLRDRTGTGSWLELQTADPRPAPMPQPGHAPQDQSNAEGPAPNLTIIGYGIEITPDGDRQVRFTVSNPTARPQYLTRVIVDEAGGPSFMGRYIPAQESIDVIIPVRARPTWIDLDNQGEVTRFTLENT